MKDLTPTFLAEKINQLLSGGVDIKDIRKMALAQDVDPFLFEEALDLAEGKVAESSKNEPETILPRKSNKPLLFIGLGVLGLILLGFSVYIFWSKSHQTPLPVEVVVEEVAEPTPAQADEAVEEDLESVASEVEENSEMVEVDLPESVPEDLVLPEVEVIEDLSNRGSQLIAESEEDEKEDELIADVELGKYEIAGLPRTVKPGVLYEFEVKVYDTDGNIFEDYDGEVQFRSTAKSIKIHPTYKFKPSDKGVSKRKVIFGSVGKHALLVSAKDNTRKRAQVVVWIRN